MNMLRFGVGIAAVLVGMGQIYITLEHRSSGQSLSAFGIATGVFFAAMGVWFALSARVVR